MRKTIRKIIPSFFILIILIGLFPVGQARAQTAPDPIGQCNIYRKSNGASIVSRKVTKSQCDNFLTEQNRITNGDAEESFTEIEATPTGGDGALGREVSDNCGLTNLIPGCLVKLFYYIFYGIPSFLLSLTAFIFNVFINITLYSNLYFNNFIPSAWGIVRDLSNIFFILILLHISIKTILGFGGHEVKKAIVNVIIMALLINFSMFFTKVVIDSSNILALVFYNKISSKTNYKPMTSSGEKDIAGSLVSAFNPTSALDSTFFDKIKKSSDGNGKVPESITLSLILISGLVMSFAIYALFISGISFVGRLIELWLLIIFSPFAFMSWSSPLLEGTEYIGWSHWSKRLIAVSFMAPIFMFFLYLIAMLIGIKPSIFDGILTNNTSTSIAEIIIGTLLRVIIPAMVILALLLKATEFAKKGGGKFGDLVSKGISLAGGLALGAATGGAALVATGTAGKWAAKTANDDELKQQAASGNRNAQRRLALANSIANKSFDLRDTSIGKFVAKKTGMDFNAGTGALGLGTKSFEGGYQAQQKRDAEKRETEFKTYQLSGAAKMAQEERNEAYEKDKDKAKKFAKENGFDFKEEEFKIDYENEEDLGRYGLTGKKGKAHSTESVEDINKKRRTNWVNNLEKPTREAARDAVSVFFTEWAKGMKKMVTTPVGLGATIASGALTAGVGPTVTVVGGGFLQALKTTLQPKKLNNAELAAMLRKGVKSKEENLLEEMKHTLGGENHKEKHEESHAPEAHAPAPTSTAHPTPPPAGGGGGAPHH